MTTGRAARHQRIAETLASQSDTDLDALLAAGPRDGVGVGGDHRVVDLEGSRIFVKRIPLTDRELAHPRSTANLFDLPMFCQYGIGGPALNAWRELEANLTVTDLVLSGETELFPLLHHWRVLPGRAPVPDEHLDLDAAVAALDDNPAVRARLQALADASSSLVLFSEFLPLPMAGWLADRPLEKAEMVERDFAEITRALAGCELLHLDAHLGNLRVDGGRIFLTDFGLATSPRFDLTADERDFVERNRTHDADYAAMRLVNWLVTATCGLPEQVGPPSIRNEFVARCAEGDIPDDVPPVAAGILARHAPAAAKMNGHYWRLFGGELDAEYGRAAPTLSAPGFGPRPPESRSQLDSG